jgi:hypothetical protein
MSKADNVVVLRSSVAPTNPAIRPVTNEVADQQRVIRDLAARYRELRRAPIASSAEPVAGSASETPQ